MDIVEIEELFLSWRVHVVFAIIAALCWTVFTCIPNDSLAWIIATPLGFAGSGLSFWWQVRADFSK